MAYENGTGDYWIEVVTAALKTAGVSATDAQTRQIAECVQGAQAEQEKCAYSTGYRAAVEDYVQELRRPKQQQQPVLNVDPMPPLPKFTPTTEE